MRTLIWFRNDLRLDDHRPLAAARATGTRGTVAVFVICPEQWRRHHLADIRVDLVRRTLTELSRGLEDLRIALRLPVAPTYEDVPAALLELARQHGCDELHHGDEVSVNERGRDEAVARAFEADGRRVVRHVDQCLAEPGTVRTGTGGFYGVFTPFRKKLLGRFAEEGLPACVPVPSPAPEMVGRPDPVPDAIEGFASPPAAMVDRWRAGEAEARRRLETFADERISAYAEDRDRPDDDGTSRLSPALAIGAISIRRCLHAAVEANGGTVRDGRPGADTWISELIWREFYRHVMVGWPRTSMDRAFKPETEDIAWSDDEGAFAAWCEGRTGFPFVDAGMRQLRSEGWMHNRLRMVTAAFLVKDLLIDWRRGERFFMRHLVDGDHPSNNGGWQWSASTGTDAQPFFRIFNPTAQGRRFDPTGLYVRRHVPELASLEGSAVHEPFGTKRSGLFEAPDYPHPIVDHAEARRRTLDAFESVREAHAARTSRSG